MWSARLSRGLIVLLVAGAACISMSLAEDQGKKTSEVVNPKTVFIVNVLSNPKKSEVKGNRFEDLRVYIRFQEPVYYFEEATRKRVDDGDGWVLDVTRANKEGFSGDPLGLKKEKSNEPVSILQLGSILPGPYVGDPDKDSRYEFIGLSGPLAERFVKMQKPPKVYLYTLKLYYPNHAEPRLVEYSGPK